MPEDPRFDAAEAALADGDYALARQRFQAILDAEPANAAASLAVKQVDLLARVEALPQTAAEPARRTTSRASSARRISRSSPTTCDGALRRLLDLLTRTSGDEREQVRQRLLEYFELLGPDDPRVPDARREMARALF